MHRILAALDRGLASAERGLIIISILAMALLSIVNVIGRNVAGNSLPFVNEVNQMLIVIVTFIGTSYATRVGRHIRMAALYDQLSGRWRKAAMVIIQLLTAGLLAYLSWLAIGYVSSQRELGSVSPALGIPWWMVYCSVPLGLGLASLQFFLGAVRNLRSQGPWLSWHQRDEYESVDSAM